MSELDSFFRRDGLESVVIKTPNLDRFIYLLHFVFVIIINADLFTSQE